VRLGWSHGDQEIFSTEEMIAAFDLPQIGRSPARFDFAKLESLNAHYMRGMNDAELVTAMEQILGFVAGGNELAAIMTPALRARLVAAMPGLKERAKTLVELFEQSRFIWASRPIPLDDQAKAVLTQDARMTLGECVETLAKVQDWSAPTTEAAVRSFAEERGIKLGAVAQPLRASLTGKTTSPPIFDVLAVLGREETLARIKDQLPSAALPA
jgi:glutamyl-tRNA synthetase